MAGVLSALPSSTLKSVFFLSGIADAVMPYGGPGTTPAGPGPLVWPILAGETSGSVIRRLHGHAGPARGEEAHRRNHGRRPSQCDRLVPDQRPERNAVAKADADGVCGMDVAVLGLLPLTSLNDCGMADVEAAIKATLYVITAALEGTLQCADRKAAFANLKTAAPIIGDFHETVQ